jgi:hypothetical protein
LRSVGSHSSTMRLWMNGARTVGGQEMTGPPAQLFSGECRNGRSAGCRPNANGRRDYQ